MQAILFSRFHLHWEISWRRRSSGKKQKTKQKNTCANEQPPLYAARAESCGANIRALVKERANVRVAASLEHKSRKCNLRLYSPQIGSQP